MWASRPRVATLGLLLVAVQAINPVMPAGHARGSAPALLHTSRTLQHTAGSVKKHSHAMRPEVAKCSTQMKELVAKLTGEYSGVQLENALVSFCITSQEFKGAARLDDGFDSKSKCEKYAHRLVAARDAEAEGETGGFTDFCRSYHHVEEEEPIMPKVRAMKMPEPKIEGLPEKRRSVWMLVGAGMFFSLLIAACLFCLAGALTRRRPQKKAADMLPPKDWLQVAKELFEKYDVDRNGTLEKQEFRLLLDDLATHVCREYDDKSGGADSSYSQAEIRQKLKWELDTDFSGKVSKQEFLSNVKGIMDDID